MKLGSSCAKSPVWVVALLLLLGAIEGKLERLGQRNRHRRSLQVNADPNLSYAPKTAPPTEAPPTPAPTKIPVNKIPTTPAPTMRNSGRGPPAWQDWIRGQKTPAPVVPTKPPTPAPTMQNSGTGPTKPPTLQPTMQNSGRGPTPAPTKIPSRPPTPRPTMRNSGRGPQTVPPRKSPTPAPASPVAVVGHMKALRLMDANSNAPIASHDPLQNGTVYLGTLPSRSLSIEAITDSGPVGSVVFASSNRRHVENGAPWAFCGNSGRDFYACQLLSAGFNATIRVTPYAERDGRGAAGRSQVVTVRLVKGLPPSPVSPPTPTTPKVSPTTPSPTKRPVTIKPATFKPTTQPIAPPTRAPIQRKEPVLVLINADTDQDVGVINTTTALIVGLLELPRVNVRVDNVPENFTGSVVWSWSTMLRTRRLVPMANEAPYTAAGFVRNASIAPGSIDYNPRTLSWNEGDYNTISAEFWSGKNGTGRYLSSVFGKIQMVGSTVDRTPPQLVSVVALSSTNLVIASGQQQRPSVTYQITVRDDDSGFARCLLTVQSRSWNHAIESFELDSRNNVQVLQRNATTGAATVVTANVTATFRTDDVKYLGTQTLKISVTDRASNYFEYTPLDLLKRNWPATLDIRNGTAKDVSPPAFLGLHAMGNTTVTLLTNGSSSTLPLQLTAQDDDSGFVSATLEVRGNFATSFYNYTVPNRVPVVGRPVTVVWNATFAIKGYYWLIVWLRDGANNTHALPHANIQGQGGTGTITVV